LISPCAITLSSAAEWPKPAAGSATLTTMEYAARSAEHNVPVKSGGNSSDWSKLLDDWLRRNELSFVAENEPESLAAGPVPKAGDPQSFVGLTEAAAIAAADRLELPNRIVERDGEKFQVTRDYRPNRLNFVIKKGIVTRVTTG